MTEITKNFLIQEFTNQMEILERDFNDKTFGHIAKVLHKHYKLLLQLIKELPEPEKIRKLYVNDMEQIICFGDDDFAVTIEDDIKNGDTEVYRELVEVCCVRKLK